MVMGLNLQAIFHSHPVVPSPLRLGSGANPDHFRGNPHLLGPLLLLPKGKET
jgi:hypothetical protein